MKVIVKKQADGGAGVTFVRDDGSATSGRLGSGGFGAVHDLAHYAVETTLGLRLGFYGLLAQGWAIADFAVKGAAGRLPDEALVAECIVGQLSNTVFAGREPPLDEFNWLVAAAIKGARPGAAAPLISAGDLRRMKQSLDGLLTRWRALPSGAAIELAFPAH